MRRRRNVPSAAAAWSEQAVSDALQLTAEGLAELVGFGTVVVSVRRDDDLVVVAVAGPASAVRIDGTRERPREMLGNRWPVGTLEQLLAVAEDWGRFKFVHHERLRPEWWLWVPDAEYDGRPGSWHPNDGAIAPILDADGVLRAAISVDGPRTGRHPDDAQRRVMDRYADGAATLILGALEREELDGRLRLAARTREIIRTASRHLSLEDLLSEATDHFREAFDASGFWMWVRPPDGGDGTWVARSTHRLGPPPDAAFQAALDARADELWAAGRVGVASYDDPAPDRRAVIPQARAFLGSDGLRSAIHAPLGTPEGCVGSLVIGRAEGASDWTEDEQHAVRDLARDLGRLIVSARTFAEAERTVSELRELDAYRSRLLSTVSHELKNPLAVVRAHLDLLRPDLADAEARALLDRVEAHALAVQRVVDDLLRLARRGDPDATPPRE